MDKDGCMFCDQKSPKYRCPKCRQQYCSVKCYKSPNHVNCSEKFFKEWIKESLESGQVSDDVKQDTISMLKEFSNNNPHLDVDGLGVQDDDNEWEDIEDLEDRLADVDLEDESEENAELILSRLTEDEKKEFQQLLVSGGISKLIPKTEEWLPWWTKARNVVVMDKANGSPLSQKELDVLKSIPLLVRTPSPNLRFCILNIIHAYCFVTRFLNGQHMKDKDATFDELLSISHVLKDGKVSFDSTSLALKSCILEIVSSHKSPTFFIQMTFEDVQSILSLQESIFKVLTDIRSFCGKDKILRKRIEFYISYTRDNYPSLRALISQIESEKSHISLEGVKLQVDMKKGEKLRENGLSKSKLPTKLVEEVSE